tara:strand:- start:1194 stop:1835 length:642 start_codon:yes stop_codon:yes gene_type:complete
MEIKTTTKEPFRVSILTPYLSESLDSFIKGCGVGKEQQVKQLLNQKMIFGYDPIDTKELTTPEGRLVLLDSPKYRPATYIDDDGEIDSSLSRKFESESESDLVISGCTKSAEDETSILAFFGKLVARYSIFYGKPSAYTGKLPEESGYSFDVPKDIETVKKLLTSDDVLDSIVLRDEHRIRESIDRLSIYLEKPILVTPFLSRALELKELGGK